MKVTVKLFATLADYLPSNSRGNQVALEVAESDPINAVLACFSLPQKLVHLVLVNGVYVPPAERNSRCLAEGDQLAVWPPIAGG